MFQIHWRWARAVEHTAVLSLLFSSSSNHKCRGSPHSSPAPLHQTSTIITRQGKQAKLGSNPDLYPRVIVNMSSSPTLGERVREAPLDEFGSWNLLLLGRQG